MAKAADFDGSENEAFETGNNTKQGPVNILAQISRLWLLTLNNPSNHAVSMAQADILSILQEEIQSKRITYVAGVMERSLTGTLHGHLMIYFPNAARGSQLHKRFPTAALQPCAANAPSVRQYLLKDKTGKWYESHPEKAAEKLPEQEANFWEWGTLPGGKGAEKNAEGKGTLSNQVIQAIREGMDDADIVIRYPTVLSRFSEIRRARFSIMSRRYRSIYRDLKCIYIEANWPPKYYQKLYTASPDTYVVTDYQHAWDSYCTEKVVVLTSYVGQFPWSDFIRYLSGCYCTLSARFSDAVACYEYIIVISPLSIEELYPSVKANTGSLVSFFDYVQVYEDLSDEGGFFIRDNTGRMQQVYLLPSHQDNS